MKPVIKATLISALVLSMSVGNALAGHYHHHKWKYHTPSFRTVRIVPVNSSLYVNKVEVTGFTAVQFPAMDTRGKNLELGTVTASRSGWLKMEVNNYKTGCEATVGIPVMKGYKYGSIYMPKGRFMLKFHPGGCVDTAMVTIMKKHGYVISIN